MNDTAHPDRDLIERLAKHQNTTVTGLARKAGLAASTLTRIVGGHTDHRLSTPTREALERAFPGFFRNEKRLGEDHERESVEIQKLDLSLSMGPGTLIDDYVEAEPVSFDLAFIRVITRTPPSRLKLVTGLGESMRPTLEWGDVIMIDTTDRMLAKQDGIYWINVYGAAGIKRLRAIGPGRVLVKSDNPTVDDQEVDAQDLRIEGRAIWFGRGL